MLIFPYSEAESYRPYVIVSEISSTPAVFAGDNFNVTITLTNVGSEIAENVILILDIEYPFALINSSSNIFAGSIRTSSSKSVKIPFSVDKWAMIGVYNIDFTIAWEDTDSRIDYTQPTTFNIQIHGKPKIDIQEMVIGQGSSKVSAGDSFIKVLNLKNIGIEEARAVQLSLNMSYPFALTSSSSNLILGDLGIGENRSVFIEVSVDRNAIGVYSIPYLIRYEDSYGWIFNKIGSFGVEVLGKPKMLIQETVASENESNILIGDTFTKIFNLTNIGGYATKRVQLSVNVSYPFTLTRSGSNILFGNLEVNESRVSTIEFSVDRNALIGVYSIPYAIIYENSYGESYTKAGIFGVELLGKPQLLIDEINIDPSPMTTGQSGLMNVKITNIGTDMAFDTSIRIFGSGSILASSFAYMAKINEKASESMVFPLSISESLSPGTYLMNISINYRDYLNNIYQLSKLHELKVSSNSFVIPPFYMGVVVVVALLGLSGYLFNIWQPDDLDLKIKESELKGASDSAQTRKKRSLVLPLIAVIFMYIVIFPIPYIVHTNLDNAGLVIQSREIVKESLPKAIQEICRLRGIDTPTILLVKHVEPEWVTMVISSEAYPTGTIVEMSDFIFNWFIDWRDFNFADRPFDKLVMSNVKMLAPFESFFERIIVVQQQTISIYDLSKVTFYGGPILFILCLTLLVQKRLALWNIPAVFGCFSLQIWSMNTLAKMHRIPVNTGMNFFGYFFVALIPVAIYALHFERSLGGRATAYKMKKISHALGLLWE